MAHGTCRLCLTAAELQKSHLIPSAFYRMSRKTGDANLHPYIVTRKLALPTSMQVRAHLQCRTCEGRFNSGGEDWLLKNCWRSDQDFPLRAALARGTPIHDGGDWRVYSSDAIPGVDQAALVYFAASVFWRAGAHEWRASVGGERLGKLDLGPYEEELRLYLLGAKPFPKHLVLIVTVSSLTAYSADRDHRIRGL